MRERLTGVLCAAATVAGAAPSSPPDPHDPALEALARSALPRARVSPLRGRVSPIKGSGSTTSGRAEAIRDMASELRAAGLTVASTDAGLRVTIPESVLFDFDRSALRADAFPTLQKLVAAVTKATELPVRIEGHTDGRGDGAYNQRLSEARAQAVRGWMIGQGVPAARLSAQGFGATRPVAPNASSDGRDDPAGRQKNRRVEVVIGA